MGNKALIKLPYMGVPYMRVGYDNFSSLKQEFPNRIFQAMKKQSFWRRDFSLEKFREPNTLKSRQVMGDDADLLWSKACGHVPDTAYKQVVVV